MTVYYCVNNSACYNVLVCVRGVSLSCSFSPLHLLFNLYQMITLEHACARVLERAIVRKRARSALSISAQVADAE